MEEVWKDITVNSLPTTPIHHHIHNIHHPAPPNSHFSISRSRDIILQDFLQNESKARRNNNNNNNTSSIESSSSQQHSTIPHTIKPPTTEFQFFDNEMTNSETHQQFPSNNASAVVHNLIGLNDGVTAFDALANSSVLTSFGGCVNNNNGCKKRVSEGDDHHGGCVDPRRKRKIKNREAAARSRAQKQAYITELELEVDQLKEENEWLRKQQRQFIEAPATQLPKKNGLHRTSTAPF